MYISHISIKNYRNFNDFEMDLKPFTLIIGENNIGKTNLLNALGLIFSQEISVFRKRVLTIEDFNYEIRKKFREELFELLEAGKVDPKEFDDIIKPEIKIEVILIDFNEDQEAVVAEWFTNRDLTEAKITYSFAPNKTLFDQNSKWFNELIADYEAQKIIKAEDINLPIAYYRYKIYGGENTSKQIDFYFLNMLKMEFLDALRDAQKELVSQNDYRLLNRVLRNKAEDSNTFKDLKDQIDNLNINISKDNDVKKLKDELSKMLKAISLNESETPVNFKFSAFDASELFKRLSLFYGDDEINIEKNGLGKNNLLYIALVLSHLEKLDEENRKVFFRLITIEEPEAHLHPHLQKHLSTKLDKQICENYNTDKCKEREGCDKRYMEKQIIVTSHSTHVTSHLPLKNTAILFDDKNKVKAHYILDGFGTDTESENHIRYLKKYLSATNSTMFFARKIILVEGISEQILIPKFYELKTGNSLEKDGITLLNVNGIAFKHFLEIINNGYYKKCLVITDSDEGTRTEERAETLKKEYEEKNKNLFCIKKTEKQTYEIDILQFNTGESEKKIIFNTLEATCPSLLKGYKKTHNDEMNVEELFKLIYNNENPKRNYKSEFAFNLSENLTKVFKVPEYIREGFKFLEE